MRGFFLHRLRAGHRLPVAEISFDMALIDQNTVCNPKIMISYVRYNLHKKWIIVFKNNQIESFSKHM